jgi:hypothetical protein
MDDRARAVAEGHGRRPSSSRAQDATSPWQATAQPISRLQRTIGNRAVGQLVRGSLAVAVQRGVGSSRPQAPAQPVTEQTVMRREVALHVLKSTYGELANISLEASVVFYEAGDEQKFAAVFKQFHPNDKLDDTAGFTVKSPEKSQREIHILKPKASFDAMVHELVHHNAAEAWNKEMRGDDMHEGVTQLLAYYALATFGLTKPSGVYADKITRINDANNGIIPAAKKEVARAYFLGDKAAMNAPLGDRKKSLIQTAWFLSMGDWDMPELGSFELSKDLKLVITQ